MENKNTETGAMKATENAPLKTALVAIIGRPSAGKSTFLNTARLQEMQLKEL